jgi:hypothetical protein
VLETTSRASKLFFLFILRNSGIFVTPCRLISLKLFPYQYENCLFMMPPKTLPTTTASTIATAQSSIIPAIILLSANIRAANIPWSFRFFLFCLAAPSTAAHLACTHTLSPTHHHGWKIPLVI